MTQHGLSFDIEDWHQLVAKRVDGEPGEPSRDVDDCVMRILDLCDELAVKGTFFTLGMLARHRPHLIKAIAERGHEIASHSQDHTLVHTMSKAELLADLRGSKRMLEDLAGHEVVGYRAPEFSVQRLDSPCFAALCEAGFRYDSSVFPIPSLRYGIAGAPHAPFVIETDAGPLVELPLATTQIARWRFPIAGGSHFRVLPRAFVTWAARRADRTGDSLVFYFHPYEFTDRWLYLDGGLARNRPVAKLVALHNFASWRIARSLRALADNLALVPLRDLAASGVEHAA
jgi:polysaccharide deacetylase family protein (PEP-CTERM system associated)